MPRLVRTIHNNKDSERGRFTVTLFETFKGNTLKVIFSIPWIANHTQNNNLQKGRVPIISTVSIRYPICLFPPAVQ